MIGTYSLKDDIQKQKEKKNKKKESIYSIVADEKAIIV